MSLTFKQMQEMYKEVVNRFNKIELQARKAEGAMIELSKQVGELAKQVMIKEKYYALTGEDEEVYNSKVTRKRLLNVFIPLL